jgi:Ca2+-binding RTX toxin-like protein
MPTTIAVEAKPVDVTEAGFPVPVFTDYQHLYLVKTTTAGDGRVLDEVVLRGGLGENGRLETLAGVSLSSSPDARGSDTPADRHQRILDLGGRDPNDVWAVMVQHATNIDQANLAYGFDIFQLVEGPDVNSNTVVASALHTIGLELWQNFPSGITPAQTPLYNEVSQVLVDDRLRGTLRDDLVKGGAGNDRIYGGSGDDRLSGETHHDLLSGGFGNDHLIGGTGDDRVYGGYGNDTLRGQLGRDAFVFDKPLDSGTNLDSLWDFSVEDDIFWLEDRVFEGLGAGAALPSTAFWIGSTAHDATDRVIYDNILGRLYYDPDGTGAIEQVAFCKLDRDLVLTFRDFQIV